MVWGGIAHGIKSQLIIVAGKRGAHPILIFSLILISRFGG